MTEKLLVELGTEELPPQALSLLSHTFAKAMVQGLADTGFIENKAVSFNTYATPRRLAVSIDTVLDVAPDQWVERRGPALKAAFDAQGSATPAALGFARSCGVSVEALGRLETDQGTWLQYRAMVPGQPLTEVLQQVLSDSLKALPIPKRMRWADREDEFVRPVHWLVALWGSKVVPVNVFGFNASNETLGHRFHHPDPIVLAHADDYVSALEKGYVVADFVARRQRIYDALQQQVQAQSAQLDEDNELLDVVTALVEWPVAVCGRFDERFLKVPEEVLIASMRDHQKYFHMRNQEGQLITRFVTISNIDSQTPERVKAGNERVLRARLADAEYFWLNDQKTSLKDRSYKLKTVLFHKKLGSLADKLVRVHKLAYDIGEQLAVNKDSLDILVPLCKADLLTEMVGEFPELQGVIGHYYALNQGVESTIASAIEQHYWPRFAQDQLPNSELAATLAIADRIDTLVGIFSCNEIPTGDRDPYALRRSALAVLRIIIEKQLDLDLWALIKTASTAFDNTNTDVTEQVFSFILERLKQYYADKGHAASVVQSVLSLRPEHPLDIDRRIQALSISLASRSEAMQILAEANKRIANILNKSSIESDGTVKAELLQKDEEKALYQSVTDVNETVSSAVEKYDYEAALLSLVTLQSPISAFFNAVLVNDEDVSIRQNRLNLLMRIRQLFLQIGDISHLNVQ